MNYIIKPDFFHYWNNCLSWSYSFSTL